MSSSRGFRYRCASNEPYLTIFFLNTYKVGKFFFWWLPSRQIWFQIYIPIEVVLHSYIFISITFILTIPSEIWQKAARDRTNKHSYVVNVADSWNYTKYCNCFDLLLLCEYTIRTLITLMLTLITLASLQRVMVMCRWSFAWRMLNELKRSAWRLMQNALNTFCCLDYSCSWHNEQYVWKWTGGSRSGENDT